MTQKVMGVRIPPSALMVKEHGEQAHRLTPQVIKAKLEGFFDGKEEEIEDEISQVEMWSTSVRLGRGIIRRKDQEIENLNRLKKEMRHIRLYVLSILKDLHPELKDED